MVPNARPEPRDPTGLRNDQIKGKKFVEDVDLISPEEFTLDGEESEMVIMCMSFDKPETLGG